MKFWWVHPSLIFVILIAVKDVILQVKPLLSKKQLFVSVAAGIKLKDLQVCTHSYLVFNVGYCLFVISTTIIFTCTYRQNWAGHDRFIRVMPNTPAAVGEAASGIDFFCLWDCSAILCAIAIILIMSFWLPPSLVGKLLLQGSNNCLFRDSDNVFWIYKLLSDFGFL